MTRLPDRSLPGVCLLPVLAVLFASAAILVPPARANGDPASDYLITLPVFFPFESKVSDDTAQELTQLLAAAKEKGFEVRVALIATRGDLGAVPVMYRKPLRYADFLGQELVYYYKGVLLVVMPNGYGVFKNGDSLGEDKKLLVKLHAPGTTDGNALAVSAQNAVRALAQGRGISLPAASPAATFATNRDRVRIVAGAILMCAVAFAARSLLGRRRNGDPDPA